MEIEGHDTVTPEMQGLPELTREPYLEDMIGAGLRDVDEAGRKRVAEMIAAEAERSRMARQLEAQEKRRRARAEGKSKDGE